MRKYRIPEYLRRTKGISHDEIVNIIKSLNGFRLVDAQDIKRERWVLTHEGELYAKHGSPEVLLFSVVPPEGITRDELQKNFASRLPDVEEKVKSSIYKIGCTQAMKNKWIEMGKLQVSRKVQHGDDQVRDLLIHIQKGEAVGFEGIDGLKRRKLINSQIWKGYVVKKGPKYAPKRKKAATDLTRENLQRGDWKEIEFKEYNFLAKGQPTEGGCLHPLLKYITEPAVTRSLPEDYVERVRGIHESGGYGSRGYGYDWKREEANKNLLRTHTTAVSSKMLYALAQGPFAPKRYYSIDRVFRNEVVDRTHLAEFHQIEGLICDRGLTLGHLIGVLHDFFSRLGMSKLKFKPAYNPYTEPSMEIFSYHDGLKKWVEVGNSGMFRPEMLLPMGLPEDAQVIAWGLSLERPTMILYGVDNIRDLFGHKVDLGLIKRNPICRLGLSEAGET